MPQLHTIVFSSGDVEHRYTKEEIPALGSVLEARGKRWVVTDVRDHRIVVTELVEAKPPQPAEAHPDSQLGFDPAAA